MEGRPGTYLGFDCMQWLPVSRALNGQMWDYSRSLDSKAVCLAVSCLALAEPSKCNSKGVPIFMPRHSQKE